MNFYWNYSSTAVLVIADSVSWPTHVEKSVNVLKVSLLSKFSSRSILRNFAMFRNPLKHGNQQCMECRPDLNTNHRHLQNRGSQKSKKKPRVQQKMHAGSLKPGLAWKMLSWVDNVFSLSENCFDISPRTKRTKLWNVILTLLLLSPWKRKLPPERASQLLKSTSPAPSVVSWEDGKKNSFHFLFP